MHRWSLRLGAFKRFDLASAVGFDPVAESTSRRSRSKSSALPILAQEPDQFPEGMLDDPEVESQSWWLMRTKSRQEKQLMRILRAVGVSHYAPQITQRYRSPSGRVRTSYVPLFGNYVFVCGDNEARYEAVCTGYVIKHEEVIQVERLVADLRQIRDLIQFGAPLSVEERLEPGQRVRVKNGSFAGYEGEVLRRDQETRLIVSVHFMDHGVSVKLDDCQLEPIGSETVAE